MERYKYCTSLRERLHEIIFEADTPAGKAFDVIILVLIVFSVIIVMLESVRDYTIRYGDYFHYLEWFVTIIFTIEYVLRIWTVKKPFKYIFSFYGIVDLVSILPTYLSFFFQGSQYLMIFRTLRLLRIFRVFKLARYLGASSLLLGALMASRVKITVFLAMVINVALISGTLMYLIEGTANNQFSSIPRSVYWAIVTMTTVGYGDIAPATELGQFIAAILMLTGYGIIAVPTGIVTSEMINIKPQEQLSTQVCSACNEDGHDKDALFCKYCGENLH